MPTANPLIRTKLHPPFARRDLVTRARLQEQVAQGLRGPLTLITAPAGFGKTTLVAACLATCGMPVAWLSLDTNDNHPGRFLNYLVAAVRQADPMVGTEAAQLIAAGEQTPPESVLTSLINDLDTHGQEIILVLDDYQMIGSPGVHEQVAFLLDHCPASFHLVIATRSDPPLPLARLRARSQTVELRAADLRFTEKEGAQFLDEVMGVSLDGSSVAALSERTEGWIAGLQMAALSMRGRTDVPAFIQAFTGTNRFILDFLVEEVLAREPAEVQNFLLRTSILNRLSGPLCDAVTGGEDGQQMLERLERANLFVIPLDDRRGWYRYHHLFSDLLQARLQQSIPEQVPKLLSRAAEWCSREGQAAEAVGYALAARDYAQAGELVSRYWGSLASNGEVELLWSWLVALPEEVVRSSAPLSIATCWTRWLKGQVGAIEIHLSDAEWALGQQESIEALAAGDELYVTLPAQVATLRSILDRYANDFTAACRQAERALELVPENLPPQGNAQLHGLISLALASAYDGAGDLQRAVAAYEENIRWSRLGRSATGLTGMTYRLIGIYRLLGRLGEAETACRDALRYLEELGLDRLPAAGIIHLGLAEIFLERNLLEVVESHLAQARTLGQHSGRMDTVRNAAPVLVRLRMARGDAPGALAAIDAAEAAQEGPSPLARAELLALRARVFTGQGALDASARCINEATRLVGQDRGQVEATVSSAATRLRLVQSHPAEAVIELTHLLEGAEATGRTGVVIELSILRALAQESSGRPNEAEADLERALTLAEREGHVRVFLDEGPALQRVLERWLDHHSADPLRAYAISLRAHFEAGRVSASAMREQVSPDGGLSEPLTRRELEVLGLLAAGLSNRQIAAQLFLSEGTVKFYVHVIMEKLDVHSRTQAVLAARERGLA